MKGLTLAFGFSLFLCNASQAGWGWNKDAYQSAKSSMVEQRITSPSYCYDTGFEFSFYGSGFWPEDTRLNNEMGGGVALAYFFGHNFGIEGNYAAHGGGNSEQFGHLNLVYRLPLGGECCSTIAPYFFGGPGVASSGDEAFLWNVGGGIDLRFESWGCIGLFGDYSYNWIDDNLPDFTQVRFGVRVPF